MKKIIKLFITCLLSFLMVTGTAFTAFADETAADDTSAEAVSVIASFYSQLSQLGDEGIEENAEYFMSYGYADVAQALYTWQELEPTLGSLVEVNNASEYLDESGMIVVEGEAVFENATINISLGYDYSTGALISFVLEQAETSDTSSLGQKIKEASVNLVVGMGTVFAVLIFLCGVIYLFRFISIAEKKLDKRNKAGKGPEISVPVQTQVKVSPEPASDNELQAVIAAAVAAYESDNGSKIDKQPGLRNGINIKTYRRN